MSFFLHSHAHKYLQSANHARYYLWEKMMRLDWDPIFTIIDDDLEQISQSFWALIAQLQNGNNTPCQRVAVEIKWSLQNTTCKMPSKLFHMVEVLSKCVTLVLLPKTGRSIVPVCHYVRWCHAPQLRKCWTLHGSCLGQKWLLRESWLLVL